MLTCAGRLCRPARVEAAGFEPASASAPSVRFYEHSFRFGFAFRDGPGRRREASPLGVPPAHRARTRRVSPLNDTGNRAVGRPDRWATDYLSSNRRHCIIGVYLCCRRFTSLQQTRLVSQDADHSRRSLCAPLYVLDSTILEGRYQHATPFGLRSSARSGFALACRHASP
jgi:hypothetical protein